MKGLTDLSSRASCREVIIQRFFENKTLLGKSAEAARADTFMRLKNPCRFRPCAEGARGTFSPQRGVSVSLAFLAAFLTRQAAAAVPVGLAAAATSAAISGGAVASTSVGVLVSQLIKAGGRTKLLTALASTVTCLLVATLALAFGAAPDNAAPHPGIGSQIGTAYSQSANPAEVADLIATLRRTETALRHMDNTALAAEIAFTDARAAGQWEKMARLFAANSALKSTAVAHFGPAGNNLTAIPTFDDRLNDVIPALDVSSADFRIQNNRAVARFAYHLHVDIAGGAIYFLRVDGRWRIDAGTSVSILLEGSVEDAPRRPFDMLSDSEQHERCWSACRSWRGAIPRESPRRSTRVSRITTPEESGGSRFATTGHGYDQSGLFQSRAAARST